MKVENCYYQEKSHKEHYLLMNFMYGLLVFLVIKNVFTTESEHYVDNVIFVLEKTIIIMLLFKILNVNFEKIIVSSFVEYKRFKNRKKVFQLYRTINRLPHLDINYYKKGVDKEFLKEGIDILKNLPMELRVVNKRFPVNVTFKRRKKEDLLGIHSMINDNPHTSSIEIYSLNESYDISRYRLRTTIYHEMAHHVDEIMAIIYKDKKKHPYKGFSEIDEEFLELYHASRIDIDYYFLEEPREFFAETISMYLTGRLTCPILTVYYEKMFKKLINDMKNFN